MVPVTGKVQVGLAAAAAVFAVGEVASLWFGAFIAVGVWRWRREDGE